MIIDFIAWFLLVWIAFGFVTFLVLNICHLAVFGWEALEKRRVRRAIVVDTILWPLTWIYVIPLFVKKYRKDRGK